MINITRSTALVLLSRVSGKVITLVGITLFARLLTPAQLGIFFLFQMALGMLAIPADFGRGEAIIKRLSEGERPGNILGTAVVFLFASVFLVVAVILLLQNLINDYLGAELAIYLALGIALLSIYNLPMSVLKGELRVGETAYFDVGYRLCWVGLGLALVAYAGLGVYGMVYALLTSYLVMGLIGITRITTTLGKPTVRSAKSLFNYWKYGVVYYVDTYLYNWLDIAVIGFFLTQADVGVYEIAWRVAGVVILVSAAIDTNILPQISEWHSQDENTNIEDLIPQAITASLFFVIPAFFGSLLLSQEGLRIIFGPEYQVAWLLLVIFLGGKVIESYDKTIKNVLLGMDFPNLRMRAVLISLSLNIVLNVTLVWQFGIIGAAIATTASFVASTLITTYYIYPKLSFKLPYRNIGWFTASSVVMVVILYIIKQQLAVNNVIMLLGFVFLGGLIYILLVLAYTPLRNDIFSVIRSIVT